MAQLERGLSPPGRMREEKKEKIEKREEREKRDKKESHVHEIKKRRGTITRGINKESISKEINTKRKEGGKRGTK